VKEKRREAGALERENGSAGNDGKREKAFPFPAFPARFKFFPLPSLRAFLHSATVGGLCGGESAAGVFFSLVHLSGNEELLLVWQPATPFLASDPRKKNMTAMLYFGLIAG